MNILVTGAHGQLGSELNTMIDGIFTDVDELDITNSEMLSGFVERHTITHIINCAAYTQVDNAEREKEQAFFINRDAVKNLANVARMHNIRLVHISTDFVFNGSKNTPYTEDDMPDPISAYGASKYEGERAIVTSDIDYAIVRTSWLYSTYGNNFVKTIARLAKEKKSLRVVYDQVGTPTYANDLAQVLSKIVGDSSLKGVYHYSNEGVASWYDFAKAIVDIMGIACTIEPVVSSDYPALAKRPPYSVMDKSKIKKQLGISIPYWRDSLQQCLNRLHNG